MSFILNGLKKFLLFSQVSSPETKVTLNTLFETYNLVNQKIYISITDAVKEKLKNEEKEEGIKEFLTSFINKIFDADFESKFNNSSYNYLSEELLKSLEEQENYSIYSNTLIVSIIRRLLELMKMNDKNITPSNITSEQLEIKLFQIIFEFEKYGVLKIKSKE